MTHACSEAHGKRLSRVVKAIGRAIYGAYRCRNSPVPCLRQDGVLDVAGACGH